MRRRHLPRLWLMTDERMGEGLWDVLTRLPRGSGVVFRHYATPAAERRRMFAKVTRIAKRRGLVLLRAGAQAMRHEGGSHNQTQRAWHPNGDIRSRSAHNRADILVARRAGADMVFVSPVFATRSHPGAWALGVVRLGLMMRGAGLPAVALGGMDARGWRRVKRLGLWGWAGIDAFLQPGAAKPRRET